MQGKGIFADPFTADFYAAVKRSKDELKSMKFLI